MELIAAIIGFVGAALIGFATTGSAKRPQAFTIIGTALVVVAVILLFLVVFNVNGR
jgi:hypothetical protein